MFLLIPNAARYASQMGYAFTFQYVSINTYDSSCLDGDKPTLHSNMFLLIRVTDKSYNNGYEPLHSNMFLLIL